MKYIIWGDPHLTHERPVCRTDPDWLASQAEVVQFIADRCKERNATLVCTGDLLDTPRVAPEVISMFLRIIDMDNFIFIAGNHSLLYHKQEELYKGSLGILATVGNGYMECFNNSENGRFEHAVNIKERTGDDITLVHTLTFKNEEDMPFGVKAITAKELSNKYRTEYIFTGDHHHKFIANTVVSTVINPGCSMIMSADMLDYKPSVYYLDTYTDTLEEILLPNRTEYITRSHLEEKMQRLNRYAALIEAIPHNGRAGMSFLHDLEKKMNSMKVSNTVKEQIGRASCRERV